MQKDGIGTDAPERSAQAGRAKAAEGRSGGSGKSRAGGAGTKLRLAARGGGKADDRNNRGAGDMSGKERRERRPDTRPGPRHRRGHDDAGAWEDW